ncbi:MAG: hypothetical protein M1825_005848 [Sarcosagium campestre]|nr:MAG: hypothetical protein M1825_005848 [Sarcosagium campestre]
MKFAKELEEDLVPEWRAKYFDYKVGKKKLKAVARALRGVNSTPRLNRLHSNEVHRRSTLSSLGVAPSPYNEVPPASAIHGLGADEVDRHGVSSGTDASPRAPLPVPIPGGRVSTVQDDQSGETQSLRDVQGVPGYGSFVPSPPAPGLPQAPSTLHLPDPAIDPADGPSRNASPGRNASPNGHASSNAYEIGRTHAPAAATMSAGPRRVFGQHRSISNQDRTSGGLSLHRILARSPRFRNRNRGTPGRLDVPLEAYREFDIRQVQFFTWMDKELSKIESFYKSKEDESEERLAVLRAQLHEMRDRRIEEVVAAQRARDKGKSSANGIDSPKNHDEQHGEMPSNGHASRLGLGKLKPGARVGKNSKALHLTTSPNDAATAQHNHADSLRDFTRRVVPVDDVPYRQAKRKLKLALAEFYRGLELLKSYALLNRKAFRKMNKKYDKAIQVRPTGRYMAEKVNDAWFVRSAKVDAQLQAVEDLYARYFERGNHKVAVGKLRRKDRRWGEYHASVYRNGLWIGAGVVFGIQGLVLAADRLSDEDATKRVETSYLLQIYAGCFLAVLLFLLFCLACRLWTVAKINYVFIFEFETRHNLDWRQLAELPSFFLFLCGFILWLNFQTFGLGSLFIYFPVILIGLTMLILCFPAPTLYHRSRSWWLYSNWRLILAGLYPVEFRDFFLGDMYCSQTYTMGNISLFFCLYARHWSDPVQCNSSHSRLIGFFATLPGIWRGLQCLRRYYDTRNVFPHLVNGGKYTFTVLTYMSLSLYRINRSTEMKALFIFCATINAIYCSVWDLAMDWSLCNPYSKHPFLRDVLGYSRPWVYYVAMILDPLLRFNWIFYAFFPKELQHSALLSFFVSLSEVLRRGMWTLFRVENEHCTNVGRFRASRDVPLPYDISTPSSAGDQGEGNQPDTQAGGTENGEVDDTAPVPLWRGKSHTFASHETDNHHVGTDLERATSSTTTGSRRSVSSLRRRQTMPATSVGTPLQRGIVRVGTLITEAHAQDFERKRTVEAGTVGGGGRQTKDDRDDAAEVSSDDDDDDDDDIDDDDKLLAGRRGSSRSG